MRENHFKQIKPGHERKSLLKAEKENQNKNSFSDKF